MTALSIVTVCAVAAAASAWEVPAIPAGRRAQFYLLKDDGAYQYGYDTGTGHSASAAADAANEVQGAYRYRAADGRDIAVSYSAGQGGYVPQLGAEEARAGHISPPVGAGPRISGSGATTTNGAVVPDADYDANADASYSFTIDTDSYKRKEEADARGNVRGSYSYSSPQGGSHSSSYTAGEGTGFVLTGGSSSSSAAATVGGSRLGSSGAVAKGLPKVPSVIPYSSGGASTNTGASTPYSGPLADIRSDHNADGSYSFSYGTDVLSREESADAQNNVRGSYSFKSDGATRRVDYEAGAATGFVARGDHLPLPPPVSSTPALHSVSLPTPVSIPAAPAVTYSAPRPEVQDTGNVDGSYSFAFNTADQSRQETSDARNNVRGSYSFKAKDDGKVRRIDYEAGSATGFIARGDHLPVAPAGAAAAAPTDAVSISSYSAPSTSYLPPLATSYPSDTQTSSNVDSSYSFAYSTNDQSRQESADAHNNVRGSYSFTSPGDNQRLRVDYEAGAATGFIAKGAHLPVPPALPSVPGPSSYSAPAPSSIPITSSAESRSALNPDGSYAFSYSTGQLSREESADAQNNVRGSYSYRTKGDGKTRRVDYEAGAATGFTARGDHLPRAPPSSPVVPTPALRVNPPAAVRGSGSVAGDPSYTFSYDAGDHSRQEAADSAGNVRGSFSFVAKDDGRSRRVDYSAGAATGFVATGEHLPAAPVAASAPAVHTYSNADASSSPGDASYAYSYETDSSKKTESADARGNVRGEYSYVAGDGSTRRVTYTARNEEGFVASGDLSPSAAGAAAVQTAKSVARTNQHLATSHAHGSQSNAALKLRTGGLTVDQYLPPQSSHKFGYVYDTKA